MSAIYIEPSIFGYLIQQQIWQRSMASDGR